MAVFSEPVHTDAVGTQTSRRRGNTEFYSFAAVPPGRGYIIIAGFIAYAAESVHELVDNLYRLTVAAL